MILEVCTNLTMVKIFDQSALWARLAMLEKIFHVTLYKDYYIDGRNTHLISLEKMSTGVGKKAPPNYTPGWIFWTMIFYDLKKIHIKIYLIRGQTLF